MYVIKRNGKEVVFDKQKIVNAISKANAEVPLDRRMSSSTIEKIADEVEERLTGFSHAPNIEEIQDIVEVYIMRYGTDEGKDAYEVAQKYIRYRYQKNLDRHNKGNTTDDSILTLIDNENEEIKQENSNKNPMIASTQRDYMAGEVSKDITRRKLLPQDIWEAHENGIIHFHDSDYFIQHIHNCCLINLEDMLQNGTVISETTIDTPKSFITACNIATQIVNLVASNQYGGQTFTLAHLAPFVDVSRQKISQEEHELYGPYVSEEIIQRSIHTKLMKVIATGIQTIQYQLVTLATSNGQTPFVTMCLYVNEVPEGQVRDDLALLIEEVLTQRILGIKNEVGVYVTPAFPKLIYILDENNYTEGTKYWHLTVLAAKCTAKRMVPDYVSAKKAREYKKGSVYPPMGCVDGKEVVAYRINGKPYLESIGRMWNRVQKNHSVKVQPCGGHNFYMDLENVEIWDTKVGDFVPCKRMNKNEESKMLRIGFSNGLTLTCTDDHPLETLNRGVVYAGELRLFEDTLMVSGNITPMTNTKNCGNVDSSTLPSYVAQLVNDLADPDKQSTIALKSKILFADFETRKEFVKLFMDACMKTTSYQRYSKSTEAFDSFTFTLPNREIALQMMYLLRAIGKNPRVGNIGKEYIVNVPSENTTKDIKIVATPCYYSRLEEAAVSYDVTTDSEHFEVSGIYSHNCRSFLTPDRSYEKGNIAHAKNFKEGEPKYYGRFNQGVVTINLPHVALSSGGDFEEFWKIFEDRLELCHRALRKRHERLLGTVSDIAPIQWQNGALARLKKGEVIDPLLRDGYSTISLGYAGLYECVKYMTGKSHTDPEAKPFALSVMQKMNDKCAEWKEAENIDYSVYGTPIESVTYKFAKANQKQFGIIKDVTDHGYITNSYHLRNKWHCVATCSEKSGELAYARCELLLAC